MRKYRTVKNAALFLCLAALLLGTFVIPGSYMRNDLTAAHVYRLSDGTKNFLDAMERDTTVYVFGADGSDMKLEYFLETLADHGSHVTVRFVRAEKSGDLLAPFGIAVETWTEEQIESLQYSMVIESEKRSEILSYTDLFYYLNDNTTLNQAGIAQMTVSEYYGYYQSFYQYASQNDSYATYLQYLINDSHLYFRGEAVLTAAIEYVTADIIPVAYVLNSGRETAMDETFFANMLDTLEYDYRILDWQERAEIPEDAASVLVLAPSSDYTEEEIAVMKAYLARGGQMTFLTDEANLSMPNLMSLMAEYGMTARPGAVGEWITVTEEGGAEETEEGATETEEGATETEEGATETEEGASEEAEPKTEASYTVEVMVNTLHDAMADASSETSLITKITNGNAIEWRETADPSLLLTELLTTVNPAFIGSDTDATEKRVLGAAAENASGTRLVWFTGAESFLASMSDYETLYLQAQEDSDNEEVLASLNAMIGDSYCVFLAMQWTDLSYESALMLPDDVLYDAETMTVTDTRFALAVAVTVLCPLVTAGVGVLVWYKRKHA